MGNRGQEHAGIGARLRYWQPEYPSHQKPLQRGEVGPPTHERLVPGVMPPVNDQQRAYRVAEFHQAIQRIEAQRPRSASARPPPAQAGTPYLAHHRPSGEDTREHRYSPGTDLYVPPPRGGDQPGHRRQQYLTTQADDE